MARRAVFNTAKQNEGDMITLKRQTNEREETREKVFQVIIHILTLLISISTMHFFKAVINHP